MDVYELHVDRGGHKMTEVQPVDELTNELLSNDAAKSPTTVVSETIDGPSHSTMITLGVRTTTTRTKYDSVFTERGTRVIDATRMSITELVSILTTTVDQPVVGRTGLTGVYQFNVELPPDATAVRRLMALGISTTVQAPH